MRLCGKHRKRHLTAEPPAQWLLASTAGLLRAIKTRARACTPLGQPGILALLLASCAPHVAVQTPAPTPAPVVACTPVWIPLKSADMYYAYDWACIGGNAIGGVYLVSLDPDLFTAKAWNASLHDWVTVATKQPLAIAQKAVTDYLANPAHASLWRRLGGCWGEFGDCRGWLIFGWAYPLWILFGGAQ